MDIGTAKPSADVQRRIAHHMIDVADPNADYSVRDFQLQGRRALESVRLANERVVVAGGSGLHFRSLVDPMTFAPTDPAIRAELEELSLGELQQALLAVDHDAPDVVDMRNSRRLIRAIEVWRITARTPTERSASVESGALRDYQPVVEHVSFGVDAAEGSQARIESRFDVMLDQGLLEEVRSLAPVLGRTASQAVGYRELLGVVGGVTDVSDARTEAILATNALAKRQRTYFRRDPRIAWIPWQVDERARIEGAVNHIGEVTGWIL
jgi:tRNA dimethylallyltransferase